MVSRPTRGRRRPPCTSGNSIHENRETSEMPETDQRGRPAGEGNSHTTRVHVFEASDRGTAPMNHSNKSETASGERGGKTADRGEHSSIQHALDTERGLRVPV